MTYGDKVVLAVPLIRLSEVVLVGYVGATTPALRMLLDAGIPLSFVTLSGKLRGRLTPPRSKNLPLRHAQYDKARDAAFCLSLARAIVDGKLRNTRSLAYRLRRSHPELRDFPIERIEEAISSLPEAKTMSALRGLEGIGARVYFAMFRQSLHSTLAFGKRSRRPPRDPVNALLSLGYTLLTQNLMTACEVVGLDPYDGFFHADKYGRPALALDLEEEFRGPVVDSVIRSLVNKGVIKSRDFRTGKEGNPRLTRWGLQDFFEHYGQRLNAKIFHPYAKRRLSYQKIFEVQARLMAKVIQGERDRYEPFRIR